MKPKYIVKNLLSSFSNCHEQRFHIKLVSLALIQLAEDYIVQLWQCIWNASVCKKHKNSTSSIHLD